jgi:hypothetical protein
MEVIMQLNFLKNNYFGILAIFILSFFFHFIFILRGIDLFDTGIHLTHQILATTVPIELKYTMPVIYLTDFIGGLWLRLIDEPSLLWARLGGILVISLNASIIFSILSNYFERNKVFIVVLISVLFITTIPALNIIDYFTLPALLINIELWIFSKTLMLGPGQAKRDIYCFFLGFMCIPIILSKFTLILIVLIPLSLLIYVKYFNYALKLPRKMLVPAFLGLIFSVVFFSVFYWHLGILDDYVKYIFYSVKDYINQNPKSFDSSHNVWSILAKYVLDYIIIIVGAITLSVVSISLYFIKQRFNQMIVNAFVLILIAISSLIMYALIIYKNIRIESLVIVLVEILIGLMIVISILYLLKFGERINVNFLLIAGLIVMLITPMGSNTGMIKSIQGMWLILPLSILCVDKIAIYKKYNKIQFVLPSLNIILMIILVISIVFHVAWVYGDDLNPLHLNTPFSTPSLYGIFSTPEKCNVIDEFILSIDNYSNKGDYVAFSPNMPIFYYLTETNPVSNPWIEGNVSSLNDINIEHYPKLIAISKVDTSDRNWPDKNIVYGSNNYSLDLAMLKHNYRYPLNRSLLWQNKAFVIYGID